MRLFFWIIWFFAFIAAINTGNNLFYLVFSVCSAFMITPRYAADFNFKNIAVSRTFPYALTAGSEVTVPVTITNNSNSQKYFLQIDETANNARADGPNTAFNIKAFSSASFNFKFSFKNRGLLPIAPTKIFSAAPLLMVKKSVIAENDCKIIVFPKIPDIKFQISNLINEKHSKTKTISSYSDDFAGFKNYQTSDAIRKINWHHYVVTRNLFVAKYEQTQSTSYTVILFLPSEAENKSPLYEAAISAAAGIASTLIKAKIEFKLITVSNKIIAIDSKYSNLNKIMTHLALLHGTYNINRNTIHKIRSLSPGHTKTIVISSAHFGSLDIFFKIHEESLSSALIFKPEIKMNNSSESINNTVNHEKYQHKLKSNANIYELDASFPVKAVNL